MDVSNIFTDLNYLSKCGRYDVSKLVRIISYHPLQSQKVALDWQYLFVNTRSISTNLFITPHVLPHSGSWRMSIVLKIKDLFQKASKVASINRLRLPQFIRKTVIIWVSINLK